jgi:hypothetical protein
MNKEEKKLVAILKAYQKALKTLDGSKLPNFHLEGAIMEIDDIIFDQGEED